MFVQALIWQFERCLAVCEPGLQCPHTLATAARVVCRLFHRIPRLFSMYVTTASHILPPCKLAGCDTVLYTPLHDYWPVGQLSSPTLMHVRCVSLDHRNSRLPCTATRRCMGVYYRFSLSTLRIPMSSLLLVTNTIQRLTARRAWTTKRKTDAWAWQG